MKPAHQTALTAASKNPFTRCYQNLRIERSLLITYANDCPPCCRPVHESQAQLQDHELQLFPCIFNDDFALISEGHSIPDDLDDCCPCNGLVRQVVYAVFNEREHIADLHSLEQAQALIRHLSFETGRYSQAWEISTLHLPEEAVRYLVNWIGRSPSRQTGLLFEPFALPDCYGFGCKLICTPWTNRHLLQVVGHSYGELRQQQLAAGVPETLVDILYLAALADTRFLIFDPSASTLEGLPVYKE
ncbi:ABC transporter substrate-binding protein [Pseudomonas sp. GD03721]|nr:MULTISPECIES: ABC transporter substrate-binding protein [unclassified Pseudomonas]MDH1440370.1 ABC transporter substrate-binding protein [Pseudomonas sp. GD03722]WGG03540.1 ABC transporter substrate-binding protein [Pseudomonas sp. GD03721]WGG07708.1 ABC transporter substrate-binding protein [Pseudomonas sp. GD03919]